MSRDHHQRAAELHDLAAHAHRVAATHHGKEDHQSGHEHSKQAMEHSTKAYQQSQEAFQMSAMSVGRLTGNNYEQKETEENGPGEKETRVEGKPPARAAKQAHE